MKPTSIPGFVENGLAAMSASHQNVPMARAFEATRLEENFAVTVTELTTALNEQMLAVIREYLPRIKTRVTTAQEARKCAIEDLLNRIRKRGVNGYG